MKLFYLKTRSKIRSKLKDETVWFTQKQMAELFGKDRRTITRHIQNIYKDEELSESSVYSFLSILQKKE